MKRYFILFIIIQIFFLGCNKVTNLTTSIELQGVGQVRQLSISTLGIDDVKYVPLATDSIFRLTEIIKMKVLNGKFYINDRGRNSKILKFNDSGDFLYKIGNRGKGPQEYLFSTDFSVAPQNKNVYVLSSQENKIYVYAPDGTFIRTLITPSEKTSILYCLDNNIFCYNENVDGSVKESIYIIDYEGNTIKNYANKFPYRFKGIDTGFNECILYSFENQLNLKELHSDTLFVYSNFQFTPKYIFKQGAKKILPEVRSTLDLSNFITVIPKYIIQRSIFESKNYFFFLFDLNNQYYCLIYFKKDGTQLFIDGNKGFINDFDGGPNILPKTIKDDNTIVSWIEAYELKAYVASKAFKNSTPKYPEKKKELEELANNLNENDNPVLMLVKLKE
jgi:WD40 repeat protein